MATSPPTRHRVDGSARHKVMTLATSEFIRRFLIHVLPKGFHRIRHYGLFASGSRAGNIARARQLLAGPIPETKPDDAAGADTAEPKVPAQSCPCCSQSANWYKLIAASGRSRLKSQPCSQLAKTVRSWP